MNLPNKLTMLRILLIPVFMVFVEWDSLPGHILWAFVIFVAASLTDYIDGYIARKNNMVTDFGKFMDPLADKILVMQHGRITEMGNHEELMAKKGYYYELVQLQTGEDLV